MAIDTTAMLEQINSTQQRVFTSSQGIANYAGFKDFSATERESIATLAATYQKELEGLQLGHSVFEKLTGTVQIDMWKTMRDKSIEFIEKLESARTYEDWKIVFALAKKWFDLMREIVRDDTWTALLGSGGQFFETMTALGGIATLPVFSTPASMIDSINRETDELLAAKALFIPEVITATKMILDVSEEEPI